MAYQRLDLEGLKRQVDIVRVIGSYLELTKKGSNYVAICPFHNDSRPSLSVSPSKQIFNCFVCHTGGDAFSFIQKYEKIGYLEAVKKACDICGVPCEIQSRAPSESEIKNQPLYRALDDLAQYYSFYLETENGRRGLDYLTGRGLDLATIKKFRLGYAPDDPSLSINVLRSKKNHSVETLTAAGIIAESSGSFSDRYSGRIMFPLADSYGRVVGFSGRLLEKSTAAKYVNSPETALFKKNELLYNFAAAREEAKKLGFLYIVEGFMDVIALEQCQLPAVGLMGTALTKNHAELLRRLQVEIRLSLDADSAGQMSTQKCARLLTECGVRYKIVTPLVSGKDPDELLRSSGPQQVNDAMKSLEEPLIHLLKYARNSGQLETYEQKESFIEDNRRLFAAMSPLMRQELLPQCAALMNLSPESLAYVLKAERRANPATGPIYSPVSDRRRNLFDLLAACIEKIEGVRADHQLLITEARILNYIRSARQADADFGDEVLVSATAALIRGYFADRYRSQPALARLGESDIAAVAHAAQENQVDPHSRGTAAAVELFLSYCDPIDYETYNRREFADRVLAHRQLRLRLDVDSYRRRDVDEVNPDLSRVVEAVRAAKKKR